MKDRKECEDAYYASNANHDGKPVGTHTGLWRTMPPCALPDGRVIEGRARLVQFGAVEKPKPGKDGKPWEHDAWRVVLRAWYPNGTGAAGAVPASLPTYYAADYRTGTGHRVPVRVSFGSVEKQKVPTVPKVWEVLYSLCSDASAAYGNTFEDFCSEFGSNPDSVSDRETFMACVEVAARLPRFLGVKAESLSELGAALDSAAYSAQGGAR